jgi:segregation and condensation protein A
MTEGPEDYRIELDIYNGPLDLLLYLVYKNEVDIFNIPVAGILEQYLAYVEVIKELDIETAGDFMVMASRLMNIKSKMLMPRPEAEPEEEEVIDPRAELVRELLEYKESKEHAYALEQKRLARDAMFERTPPGDEDEPEEKEPPELFEGVTMWDLLIAFHKATKDFMPEMPRRIVYDDTPVSVYMNRLLEKLAASPGCKVMFSSLFDGLQERVQVIGMFLGILEGAKQGALKTYQVQGEGEIYIELIPEEEREKNLEVPPENPERGSEAQESIPQD